MMQRNGLTLAEVLFVIAVLVLLFWLVVVPLQRRAAEARQAMCRSNLNQIAKGMAVYLNLSGDNRYYPVVLGPGTRPDTYNGAEWLAAVYWGGCIPDPGVFLCPASGDTNRGGRDIGTRGPAATFGSQTVSYAGMHYYSTTDATGRRVAEVIRDDFPPDEPMGSDDTQGTINHGGRWGGMNVLFFDSHVELRTPDALGRRTAVGATAPPGQPKPLLWRLRN